MVGVPGESLMRTLDPIEVYQCNFVPPSILVQANFEGISGLEGTCGAVDTYSIPLEPLPESWDCT